MFQPRQFLKRSSGLTTRAAGSPAKVEHPGKPMDRHPAMRGIDVSPVHGRHCICARCARHSAGA